MNIEQSVGGRDRLAHVVLAVALTIVTIRALKRRKKMTGLLAGFGALGFGFNATTCLCGLNKTLGTDTTDD